MLHPQVTVRVEAYATQNVSVMGEVQKPGPYEIDTPHKVVEVLALAAMTTCDGWISILFKWTSAWSGFTIAKLLQGVERK